MRKDLLPPMTQSPRKIKTGGKSHSMHIFEKGKELHWMEDFLAVLRPR